MKNSIQLLLLLVLISSGCTTVKTGLVGERRENLVPFAETTVEFLGSASVDFRANELIYLREYYDADAREIARLKNLLGRVDGFRDQVVYYSVELVRITDQDTTGEGKCADLADALSGDFREGYLRHTDLSPSEFDAVVAEIRQQETILAALRIMQPLIVLTGDYFENLVREAQDEALPDVRMLLDASIEEEYGTVRRQLEIVYDRRDELLTGLQMIRAFRGGDDNALTGFNGSTILPNRNFELSAKPSDSQLDRTKSYIVEQMQQEEIILGLLQRDLDSYVATRAELDAEELEINDGLDLARRQIVAWIGAHEQLADGVRNPGRWFKAMLDVAAGVRKMKN